MKHRGKQPSTKALVEAYAKYLRNLDAPIGVQQRLYAAWRKLLASPKFADFDTTSDAFMEQLRAAAEQINKTKLLRGPGSDY